MYQAGVIGFSIIDRVPKVGQLQGSAWSWTDTCRFRFVPGPPPLVRLAPPLPPRGSDSKRSSGIRANNTNAGAGANSSSGSSSAAADSASKSAANAREAVVEKPDMPPPPSPASSTCSETGSVAGGSSKKHKRPAPRSDEDKRGDEEEWVLKDAIFIEDVKNVPVGRVLKVDGAYAAVRFPANKDYCGKEAKDLVNSASSSNEDPASLLQDCRLLRKDELQVLDIFNSFVSILV